MANEIKIIKKTASDNFGLLEKIRRELHDLVRFKQSNRNNSST